jgi:hypothetical protein
MFSKTTFTSLAVLAALAATPLAAARAQSGNVAVAPDAGNVVGGGGATLLGGGDDMVILYSRGGAGGGAGMAQAGRSARFAPSTGDGEEVQYLETAPTSVGREARLLGGGDNAEVVYSSPMQRR